MSEAENHVLPSATNDSWRAWLMTGARRRPIDRRRMRGEHVGLKRMLLEGMNESRGRPLAWKDFSGAMIRHAIDEAMRSLPAQDSQVVKLAYFGGYSNREIADRVGLTEATVQRRLKRALSSISELIQHGRSTARRAVYALTLWLSGRWLSEGAHHVMQSTAVVATAVIISSQAAPAGVTQSVPGPGPGTQAPHSAAAPTSPLTRFALPPPAIKTPAPVVPPAPNIQVPPIPAPPVTLPVSLPSPTPPPIKLGPRV